MLKLGRRLAGALVAAAAFAAPAYAQTTLKVALHSDLKIVDPIWTTALISTHHGYMVYDTLFALDEKLEVKPQMVDKWEVSPDKLTWTFTLRDGLEWHDGKPVTAEDCVASHQALGRQAIRWARSSWAWSTELSAPDAKTIKMVLKEPYGLVLRIARQVELERAVHDAQARSPTTDPNTQITDIDRLGPVHLQEGRVEAGREGGLRQEPQVQAAQRAGLGPGRRQGRQGRPRRMDHDPRPRRPR